VRAVIAAYHLAAAVALALMLVDAAITGLAGPEALPAAGIVVLSGLLTAGFLYGYMRYALEEWGDFAAQSWQLAAAFPLAYAMAYTAVTSLSLAGIGAVSLAVWAAFAASAGLVLYAVRHVPPHLSSGAPLDDIVAGARLLTLAIAAGIPLAWLLLAAYEMLRMLSRRAYLAGLSVLASIASIPLLLAVPASVARGALGLQLSGLEILLWPGIIGWEELISRFLLPAVGPLANYTFVALHAPSRWLAALTLAPAVLAVISMATRWVTDVYRRHGLIGAISAHAVYNGMIGWLLGMVYFPLLTAATLAVLIFAYARARRL
jgi:hypothetical protein